MALIKNQNMKIPKNEIEKDIEFISNFNPAEFLNTLPIVFDNKKMNAYIYYWE